LTRANQITTLRRQALYPFLLLLFNTYSMAHQANMHGAGALPVEEFSLTLPTQNSPPLNNSQDIMSWQAFTSVASAFWPAGSSVAQAYLVHRITSLLGE